MADQPISSEDKKLMKEIEHTKHGREFYNRSDEATVRHDKEHKDQAHTVHGNEAGDNPPHIQHDGPDERPS